MRNYVLPLMAAGLIALASANGQAAGAGDPEAGGDVFDSNCSDCHSVSAKGLNHKGPTLYGIIGRRSATVGGFDYSAAMRKAGIVWTPDKIDAYLASPQTVVPGGIMKFKGLPKPADRANVIAYLAHPN